MDIATAAAFGINPASWGFTEIAIVLGVFLLLFGPKQLPKLARSMGQSITDFKRAMRETHEALEKDLDEIDQEVKKEVPK